MLTLLVTFATTLTVSRHIDKLSTGLAMQRLHCAPATPSASPPVLFVHGTFHGAWCWEAHWLEFFGEAGLDAHAVSLRGTSGSPAAEQSSVRITEHVDDLRSLVAEVFPDRPPVLVGHSFGGSSCLKYVEAGGPTSGLVLLCSVPPSGNGPMVARFLRRSLRQAWLITAGFALKRAATDANVCQQLFFDERTPLDEVARYLPRLEADAQVGLDVRHFLSELPSKRLGEDGVTASWLSRAPPALVIGAAGDGVVDRDGVEETAAFLGTSAEFYDLPHDLMLSRGWEAPAERVAAVVNEGTAPR